MVLVLALLVPYHRWSVICKDWWLIECSYVSTNWMILGYPLPVDYGHIKKTYVLVYIIEVAKCTVFDPKFDHILIVRVCTTRRITRICFLVISVILVQTLVQSVPLLICYMLHIHLPRVKSGTLWTKVWVVCVFIKHRVHCWPIHGGCAGKINFCSQHFQY